MNYGRRLLPEYLVKFVEDATGIKYGKGSKRLIPEPVIHKIEMLYALSGNTKIPVNFGRRQLSTALVNKLSNTDYIDAEIEDLAYISDVPGTALRYAKVLGIGGMSYKVEVEGNYVIQNSAVTEVISKENGSTIDSIEIPADVQALDGYGLGLLDSNVYNELNLSTKKFTANTKKKIYAGAINENWQAQFGVFYIALGDNKYTAYVKNFICNKYTEIAYHGSLTDFINAGDKIMTITSTNLYIKDDSITSLADLKTALASSNLEIVYELATPVETDISEYIKKEYIKVAPGGTLTFVNEYEQDVPSIVEYIVEA